MVGNTLWNCYIQLIIKELTISNNLLLDTELHIFYFEIMEIICGIVSGMCFLRFTQKYLLQVGFYGRTFSKKNFDFFFHFTNSQFLSLYFKFAAVTFSSLKSPDLIDTKKHNWVCEVKSRRWDTSNSTQSLKLITAVWFCSMYLFSKLFVYILTSIALLLIFKLIIIFE